MFSLLKMAAFASLAGCSFVSYAQSPSESNYQLVIDGQVLEVGLDKEYIFNTKDGAHKLMVKQKPLLTYTDNKISFLYPKEYTISSAEIEDGISQVALLNANGNGYLVQKYTSIDPSGLVDMMLNEIIKENVSYGYQKQEEPISFMIKSGEHLQGKKVVLTHQDEVEEYTVATYGQKDEGILLVTILNDHESKEKDIQVLQLLLDSLSIIK